MIKNPDIAFVIPVRMGSSRIKNKVLLPFGDKKDNFNLLTWKINQLLQVTDKNHIYVTSNNDLLLSLAEDIGVRTHVRDDFLCVGHNSTVSQQVTSVAKDINHKHISWTLVTTPLVSPNDYKNIINSYNDNVINGKYDSLMSVTLVKEFLWMDSKAINHTGDKNHIYTQNLPNVYKMTNSTNIISRDLLLKKEYYLGDNPYPCIIPNLSGIDIDIFDEYILAKNLYKNYYRK